LDPARSKACKFPNANERASGDDTALKLTNTKGIQKKSLVFIEMGFD
jgi:hypothetical protein